MREEDFLFEIISRDYSHCTGTVPGVMLCPLCHQEFTGAALDSVGSSRALSLEHIVPLALGGKLKTLTCTGCNNRLGSSLDAHLVNRVRSAEAVDGGGRSLKGTLRMAERELNMKFSLSNSQGKKPVATIRIPGGRPADLQHLQASLVKGEIGNLQMTVREDYSVNSFRLSLMKAAYLALFHMYGYQYILSPAGLMIRNVIRGQLEPPIPLKRMVRGVRLGSRGAGPLVKSGGVLLTEFFDRSCRAVLCHAILLNLGRISPSQFIVALPSSIIPVDAAGDVVARVMRQFEGRETHLQFVRIEPVKLRSESRTP